MRQRQQARNARRFLRSSSPARMPELPEVARFDTSFHERSRLSGHNPFAPVVATKGTLR